MCAFRCYHEVKQCAYSWDPDSKYMVMVVMQRVSLCS